jgi:hypothetical protein
VQRRDQKNSVSVEIMQGFVPSESTLRMRTAAQLAVEGLPRRSNIDVKDGRIGEELRDLLSFPLKFRSGARATSLPGRPSCSAEANSREPAVAIEPAFSVTP